MDRYLNLISTKRNGRAPKTPEKRERNAAILARNNRGKKSRIRPFTRNDIPQVASLINRHFSFARHLDVRFISDTLEEVVFCNPWVDDHLPSLVYQHSDESIKGFLGVNPRVMKFNDKKVTLAITHNFVVEPGPHSFLTGIKMLKMIQDGPQSLMISGSAGDRSKYLIELTGGSISYIHSMYWRLPLRPFQFGLCYFSRNNYKSWLTRSLKPLAFTGDFMLGRIKGAPFRNLRLEGTLGKLTVTDIVAYQKEFSGHAALCPAYTPKTLQWVLDTAGKAVQYGKLKSFGVFDSNGNVIGWFILFLNPGSSCEILQMKARQGKEAQVFYHLINYTWKEGGVDLIGRLEPPFMRSVSQSWAICRPGRMWMILHGKRRDIISAICRGDAFLSRLEDDIWLL